MHHFQYRKDRLFCEDVPVSEIAEAVGTPFYLYSHATLVQHFRAFDGSFDGIDHLICFSMKSNSNMAVLRLFANQGGGVDIVSGGELYRALKAGVDPKKMVYSGVGKSRGELADALSADILLFNTESRDEIRLLNEAAEGMGKQASMAIRVNPDIDPQTHPYISTGLRENKFGIHFDRALDEYKAAAGLGHLKIAGVSCHIGSQLTTISPFVDTLKRLNSLIQELRTAGISVDYLDLGGGLGITYDTEQPPHPKEYAAALKQEMNMKDLTLILEPGRVITGNAGILVSRVRFTKESGGKYFVIIDAAMNDLIRPSLYDSFHAVQPVVKADRRPIRADIVGPICETSDFIARDRETLFYRRGDLIAIMSAGAYGFIMSSNYNSRPRVAEVMVKGDQFHVVREREQYEDLIRGETIPSFLLQGQSWNRLNSGK